MSERLHEPVAVRADFRGGKLSPILIKRGTRVYRVKHTHARWEDRQLGAAPVREDEPGAERARKGPQKVCFFSVELDTGDLCELRYDTADSVWWIEEITVSP